jgi:hypothetical protein
MNRVLVEGRRRHRRRLKAIDVAVFVIGLAVTFAIVACAVALAVWAISTI